MEIVARIADFSAGFIESAMALLFCARLFGESSVDRKTWLIYSLLAAIVVSMKDLIAGFGFFSSIFAIINIYAWSCLFLRKNIFLTLLYTAVFFVVLVAIDMLVMFIVSLFGVDVMTLDWARIFALIMSKSLLVLVTLAVAKSRGRNVLLSNNQVGTMAVLAVIMMSLAIVVIEMMAINKQVIDLDTVIIIAIMCLGVFIVGTVGFFKQTRDRDKKERELIISNAQNAYLEQMIENHMQSFEAWKKSIHDFKHHVFAIEQMVRDDDKQEILQYIEEITSRTNQDAMYVATGHRVADAVLSEKLRQAQGHDIEFNVDANITPEISVSNIDLCAMLGNILDNAIEASVGERARCIDVVISCEQMLNIKISNASEKNPLEQNPKLVTTKKDSIFHGLGTQSIGEICKKYGGILSNYYENGYFTVQIIFPKK